MGLTGAYGLPRNDYHQPYGCQLPPSVLPQAKQRGVVYCQVVVKLVKAHPPAAAPYQQHASRKSTRASAVSTSLLIQARLPRPLGMVGAHKAATSLAAIRVPRGLVVRDARRHC